MTLFLVIFVLESLKFRLLFQRKNGEGCPLYRLDIAPAREKPQIKPYQNNLYALTHIKSTNTANNGIKQITKEKIFQLYQCCANNFFEQIFLLTIFFIDFLYADNLFYQNGTPSLSRKIMVSPLQLSSE